MCLETEPLKKIVNSENWMIKGHHWSTSVAFAILWWLEECLSVISARGP
jgi:hypothetical protein